MKFFKKNQVLIYVIALMLVVAGYLNYSELEHDSKQIIETTADAEELAGTKNIGDAQLVNSNIVTNTTTNSTDINTENTTDTNTLNETTQNTINENEIEDTTTQVSTQEDSYFSKSKLERDTMYSQILETYEKVLNGENALETQKQSASEEIKKINDTKNSIMICENLISTKGFKNNIVFVNGDSVSVIIGATELQQQDIAQIQNIISRELKSKIEDIHIALK